MKGHSLSPLLAGTPGAKHYGPLASAGILRGSKGWGPAHKTDSGFPKAWLGPALGGGHPRRGGETPWRRLMALNTFVSFLIG